MSLISRMRRQTAVWWASNGTDQFGQPTHATPVEIACRWEGKATRFVNTEGKEVVSKALVYVDREMDPDGDMLYEGTLASLSGETDPNNVDGATRIRQFTKLPTLKATENLLTAYL